MGRWTRARWLYLAAALVLLAASFIWANTIVYSCPDAVGAGGTDCDGQGGAELVSRTIVAAIGVGFAVFFLVKAVRATRRR